MKALRFVSLFFSLILLLAPQKVAAFTPEKIEAFLLIDSESNLRNSVKKDGHIMVEFLKKVAKATNMELLVTVVEGKEVSKDRIEQWLSQINNTPHDVVLFYFSGHGCKSNSPLIPWPYLFLSQKRTLVSLENIITLLESQQTRLSLIIADCCNSTILTPKTKIPFLIQGIDETQKKIFPICAEQLFKKTTGHIRTIAATRGQNALAYNEGSLFTLALIKALEKGCKKPSTSWKSILNTTKEYCGSRQTPFSSIDIH